MTLNEYQDRAMTTCMDTCDNIPYMLFNLQGEVGELSSKIAKGIRKGYIVFCNNLVDFDDHKDGFDEWYESEYLAGIMPECGDVLWQLSGLCRVLGFTLDDVAVFNLNKLASRKKRGVIDGNGDYR